MIYRSACIKLLLFAIFLFGTAAQIFAAAGDLDWTFAEDGIATTDNGSTSEDIVDLAVLPDGKIIAIGYSGTGGGAQQRIVFVRYNANGSIDTTFGTGGKVIIEQRMPGAMALQADGKILFVSPSGASPFANFYVGRLNSDGSIDTTFNGTGSVNINLRGTDDRAYSVQVQPDGKILVGGNSSRALSSSQNDAAIVRFNPNGSLDTTFDSDGKVFTTAAGAGQSESHGELAVQPDGKILQVGTLSSYDVNNQLNQQDFLLVRYNSNGSLDTTFDGDGIVSTRFAVPPAPRTDVYGGSVALQSDGKIVVFGTSIVYRITNEQFAAAARYNADGSLDSSFAIGGKTLISFPPFANAHGRDMAIQADNKIVISGTSGTTDVQAPQPAVARLNTNGSLDTGFSGDGVNVVVGPLNRLATANAVAIQPGGKIVTGGFSQWGNGSDFSLMRFEGATCTTNCFVPRREVIADFDGDGKTDLSVFRSGTWFISPSASDPDGYYTKQIISSFEYLTPADYDGDQKTDVAIWVNSSGTQARDFFILRSSTDTFRYVQFGQAGDDPRVVGDWDGDGRADPTVYRNGASAGAQSYFYYLPSTQPTVGFISFPWGIAGDQSVRGDFDGDGKTDAAVYRPSNQIWYVQKSSDGQPIFQYWGLATDKRVSGDFDGDGKTDFVAYRDGIWYVLQSSNNQPRYASWGISGDKVVAGDYDGDGKTDFAVWRAGVYYVMQNSNSQQYYRYFGVPADIPIASVFVQ